MGSLGSASDQRRTVTTQLSVAGFDENTAALSLVRSLEGSLYSTILRCRLKTSSIPSDSYPNFDAPNNNKIAIATKIKTLTPHAFIHFNTPEGAKRAVDAAGRCELIYTNEETLKSFPLIALSFSDSLSRVNRRRTTNPFVFSDVENLHIGTLTSPTHFTSSYRLPSSKSSRLDFVIDPFDSSCKLLFTRDVAFGLSSSTELQFIRCDVKLQFLLRDIADLAVCDGGRALLFRLNLGATPALSYRTADDDIYDDSTGGNFLDDEDPWIRSVDFTPNGAIGRSSCYRVLLRPRHVGKMERALKYMKDRRIDGARPERPIAVADEPDVSWKPSDKLLPFFCFQNTKGVTFANLFMVNALVHRGVVSQHRIDDEFFSMLRRQSEALNEAALRHIYSYKNPIFDAVGRLRLVQNWLLNNPKLIKTPSLSEDNMEVRRLVITPTRAYCLPPEVELSNRVLRRYRHLSDRFLRVTFMDEGMQPLNSHVLSFYVAPIVKEISKNSFMQRTSIYRRAKDIMHKGFYLCGRRYSFLAFSSNQLRDRSAWFFAEDRSTTVALITNWMGKFHNKNVAKYAARMGLCFSSTYATVDLPHKEVDFELEDIKRNDYIFSDGIGKITPDLAMEVARKLQLSENPPSAYQIRYAGCKGVVAVWPEYRKGIRLSFRRDSMKKFDSLHTMLEIVSWTRFQPGFLNRQIVTLLSALDVQDDVFSVMQDSMVCKLDKMLVDTDAAFEVLTKSCAEEGNVAAMMLSAGFKPSTEPHLKAMLSCIRLSQLRDLSTKTRIFVEKGRWLMGCLDELGVLEQGQCFIRVSSHSLENCFLKHGSRFREMKTNKQVVKGMVAMAKNPCLHPGDVRVLEAVDVPSLHHLVDCLVFPQKGERPHSNEASGSDLDGDLYFATWDESLIPPSKRSWMPMSYTAAEAKMEQNNIVQRDIIDFFVKNMSNENLGVICNAHVVHADQSDYGAMDEKCIKLAELAATAVDFPKTGKVVSMPTSLKPKVYPDFMDKDDFQSYKSEKILGRLYRKIKDASDKDNSPDFLTTHEDLPFDSDLEICEACDYLPDAWNTKCSYDRQLNALLGQYRVSKEGEIVTGHLCSMGKHNSRKQGEIKERLKNAYYALHKQYRKAFEEMGEDFVNLTDDEKNVMYERKASAWYQVTYHPLYVKKAIEMKEPDSELVAPRLSFAWIAADYLVRIKVRCREKGDLGVKKPIDSLASYLLERM